MKQEIKEELCQESEGFVDSGCGGSKVAQNRKQKSGPFRESMEGIWFGVLWLHACKAGFGKTGDMLNVVVTSAESTPPSSTQPHRQDGSEHEWLPGSILTKLLPCLTAH